MASTDTVRTFRNGVLKIADSAGIAGTNVITVKVTNGGISGDLQEKTFVPKLNRGIITDAHWVRGEDKPWAFTITGEFRGLLGSSGTGNSNTTPWEAFTGNGSGSDFSNDDPNGVVPGRIVSLTITDPGDGSTETLTWGNAVMDAFNFAEAAEGDTFEISGRSLEFTIA